MHLHHCATAASRAGTSRDGAQRLAGIKQIAAAALRYQDAAVWPAALFAIALIGTFDYTTGTEIRTFPFYYVPISLLAWHRGRTGAIAGATACAAAWVASNLLAGLQYSAVHVWAINAGVQGASFGTVGALIAVLRESIMRERALNRIDPLTLLLNSRAFYEEAQSLVSLCHRKGYAVTAAYVDLDRFKDVNDRLGHRAGDELLRNVGGVFRRNVRPSDLVARMGGDEFAILLPHTDPSGAAPMLDRLQAALRTTFESASVRVSASIGAVSFLSAPRDLEEMVHEADGCMYAAKNQGGNQVRLTVVCTNEPDHATTPLGSCIPAKRYFQQRVVEQHPGLRRSRRDAAS